MKTLTEQLSNYAGYHRDKRNILTHIVGIPMIVLSILVLLARWQFTSFTLPWGDGAAVNVPITLALIAACCSSFYYLKLDVRYGICMAILIFAGYWFALHIAQLDKTEWLTVGLGLFIVGWIFQFVGHFFEGKKPAFIDDLSGLIIGPLFVVVEISFLIGLRPEVQADVVKQAGPLH